MEINRRHFIASLGGATAVSLMSHEAKAEALETYMIERLEAGAQAEFPSVAEIEAQVTTRHYRRGVGRLFVTGDGSSVERLEPLPEKPTFFDFFEHRLAGKDHCLQSANLALKEGMPEEVVFACLIHDTVQCLMRADHGFWGADLYAPYVSERVAFALRNHQVLRFYTDEEAGYFYPDLYHRLFGHDYEPTPQLQANYAYVSNHEWYMLPRLVTVNDLYSFEEGVEVGMDPFVDIVGRQFRQPAEGLGYDNSPSAHMWRSIANPDTPL